MRKACARPGCPNDRAAPPCRHPFPSRGVLAAGSRRTESPPDLWMATEIEKRRMSQAMAHACSNVGGRAALARAIGRPEETVSDWVNGKSLVDPELVVEIERITGVPRHNLRPDLSRIFGGQQ